MASSASELFDIESGAVFPLPPQRSSHSQGNVSPAGLHDDRGGAACRTTGHGGSVVKGAEML